MIEPITRDDEHQAALARAEDLMLRQPEATTPEAAELEPVAIAVEA